MRRHHLIMKVPFREGCGRTRCGRYFTHIEFSRYGYRYKPSTEGVTCQKCIELADVPYSGGGFNLCRKAGLACVIDGLRVPFSSIMALKRPLKRPAFDGPGSGPPYPWGRQHER